LLATAVGSASARAAFEVRRELRASRFDLIHAQYGLSGAVALVQLRVPLVTTFHGSDAYIWWQRIISSVVSWIVSARIELVRGGFRLSDTCSRSSHDGRTLRPTTWRQNIRLISEDSHNPVTLEEAGRTGVPRESADVTTWAPATGICSVPMRTPRLARRLRRDSRRRSRQSWILFERAAPLGTKSGGSTEASSSAPATWDVLDATMTLDVKTPLKAKYQVHSLTRQRQTALAKARRRWTSAELPLRRSAFINPTTTRIGICTSCTTVRYSTA
jgi:hypothetical protein